MAVLLILILVAAMAYCFWQLLGGILGKYPDMDGNSEMFLFLLLFMIFLGITGMIGGSICDAAGL